MSTIDQDLSELSSNCYAIESKLPRYYGIDEVSNEQEVRRMLYRIRIDIQNVRQRTEDWNVTYDSR